MKEESGSEQRNVIIHCIMEWGCCSTVLVFSFDYLFIFILLQNMTAYPLVATGQRKPGKSRDNLDLPVLYKQALINISEGSSQFQTFKNRGKFFSLGEYGK